jgi:hypothetical protein
VNSVSRLYVKTLNAAYTLEEHRIAKVSSPTAQLRIMEECEAIRKQIKREKQEKYQQISEECFGKVISPYWALAPFWLLYAVVIGLAIFLATKG